MKLYKYQQDAVDELFEAIEPKLKRGKEIRQTLKAPTGSGKTVMLSALIDKLSDLQDYRLCFIWMTIDKENLANQSYGNLPWFNDSLSSSEFNRNRVSIHQNEVIVINWEMVRNNKNMLRRNGNMYSFKDVMDNTRYNGISPVLIIDDYQNPSIKKANSIVHLIKPSVIIERKNSL